MYCMMHDVGTFKQYESSKRSYRVKRTVAVAVASSHPPLPPHPVATSGDAVFSHPVVEVKVKEGEEEEEEEEGEVQLFDRIFLADVIFNRSEHGE